jgi:hypothetical protein
MIISDIRSRPNRKMKWPFQKKPEKFFIRMLGVGVNAKCRYAIMSGKDVLGS